MRLFPRVSNGGPLCADRRMLARRDANDDRDELAVDVAHAVALRVHVRLSLADAVGVGLRHAFQERFCVIFAFALHLAVRHDVAVALRDLLHVADAHAVACCDRVRLRHAHAVPLCLPHALAERLRDAVALAVRLGLRQRVAERECGRNVARAERERLGVAVVVALGQRGT